MVIQIEDRKLEKLLEAAAKKGASMALKAFGHFPKKEHVSEREAIRILRSNGKNKTLLNRWIRNGEIKGERSGVFSNSKIQYPYDKFMELIERGY